MILIVNDDPALTQVLVGILSDVDSLTVADTHDEAMMLAQDAGTILYDLGLPDVVDDKIGALRQLVDTSPLTPVIVITGEDLTDAAIAAGATDVIHKPFTREALLERLKVSTSASYRTGVVGLAVTGLFNRAVGTFCGDFGPLGDSVIDTLPLG